MTRELLNEWKREKIVEAEDVVLAGVSGGADSVCLLLLLEQFQKQVDFTLEAVHVEHGIRGEHSRSDAAFVEELCEKHGIVCHTFSVDVPDFAKQHGIGLEEAARILRYDSYKKAAKAARREFPGKKIKLALAHHAEDNAETILFQMVRGSGIDGLCGMNRRREEDDYELIRPLLAQSRADIEAFLRDCGQTYCTDETNLDTVYSRNRIRHQVLPELKQINEQAVAHINQSAVFLQEMRDFLDTEADGIWEMCVLEKEDGIQLYWGVWENCHEVVQSEVIRRAVAQVAGSKKDITKKHVESVKKLYFSQVGRRVELPYQVVAERNYRGIFLRKETGKKTAEQDFFLEIAKEKLQQVFKGEPLELKVPGGSVVFRGWNADGEIAEIDKKSYTKWLNYDKIKCGLQIRTRAAGDYLTVDDAGHTKKLKEYLINEKVPREMRDAMLLLTEDSHVVWAVGQRISADYKINANTEKILEVHFFGGNYHESQEY